MQRIYLDNAATTSLDPAVLESMMPFFTEQFGNASSIYSYGREARMAIEQSRKTVALLLEVKPGEIFFTGSGTESSNTAIVGAVNDLQCKHIITSRIEHHATLYTVQHLEKIGKVDVSYVQLDENGQVLLASLEAILQASEKKTLVTLMHANNEIGNLSDIRAIGQLCKKYDAYFHSDTVQSLAHYPLQLPTLGVHFISASAHKFHGPKGSGLLYIHPDAPITPLIYGGSQERNMRAGTENVAGIVGFAKAFAISSANQSEESKYIYSLKKYMKEKLENTIDGIHFHGVQGEASLYTVLNVGFPVNERTEMLSIHLDMNGICVSAGSACTSGVQGGSHVIKGVYPDANRIPLRFSFSKHNTIEEIDYVVSKISEFL